MTQVVPKSLVSVTKKFGYFLSLILHGWVQGSRKMKISFLTILASLSIIGFNKVEGFGFRQCGEITKNSTLLHT